MSSDWRRFSSLLPNNFLLLFLVMVLLDLDVSLGDGLVDELLASVLELLPTESIIDRDRSLFCFWRNLGSLEPDGDEGEGDPRSDLLDMVVAVVELVVDVVVGR